MGDLATAKRFGREAIELRDDERFEPLIWAFCDLAQIAAFEGDIASAIELCRTGAEHPSDARDRFCAAFHMYVLALADPGGARTIAERVVEQAEAAGMPFAIALS